MKGKTNIYNNYSKLFCKKREIHKKEHGGDPYKVIPPRSSTHIFIETKIEKSLKNLIKTLLPGI